MTTTTPSSPAALQDAALLEAVHGLARRDKQLTAQLVAHLAELYRRKLALQQGYSSLFVYCRDALRMSEGEAYNRSVVAEAAVRFPTIVEALRAEDVTLTAVRLVAPHLTPDNEAAVLASIRGKRRPEVEEIVAALAPRPDARPLLRRLPAAPPPSSAPPVVTPAGPRAVERVSAPPAPRTVGLTASVMPTSPDRFRLQVTLDGATASLLRELKDLMRHAVPSGDESEIVRRALTVLHAQVLKQRCALVEKPRPSPLEIPDDERIAAHVRRFVWRRDGGQCAFVSKSGHRCTERSGLEFHHRHPRALGGPPTVENISLRCQAHNAYEAEVDFGRAGVASFLTVPGLAAAGVLPTRRDRRPEPPHPRGG